ncbi:MAG: DUF1552 domain-containing protein [Myxococcota bacterium]
MIKRRTFLGAAAGLVAAPFLGGPWSVTASPGAVPLRLVLFPSLNGTRHESFWPLADGRLPEISEPLLPIRERVSFVRGLRMEGSFNHFAVRSMFTGAPISDYANPEPTVRSFDQIVADTIAATSPTPLRSLHLGARPAPYAGAAFLGRQNIFRTASEAVAVRANPVTAFDDLFGGGPPAEQPLPEVSFEESALAITRAELQDLAARGLGPSQQRKLDAHLEALPSVDAMIPRAPTASCDGTPIPTVEALRGAIGGNEAAAFEDVHFPAIVDAQIDLMARALACGLTRVATLQSSWADGDAGVPVEGGRRLPWHPTSHDSGPAYALVQRWYVERLVRLVGQLDVPDPLDASGASSVLDHTVIVWMSECEPSHDANEISAMVVGGRCTPLDLGGQVSGGSNLELLRTLADVFGVDPADANQFGSTVIRELRA